uniref:Apolipoprotein L n=1 Tax=Neolamprologus brichardi TaxID=32507 RepID=A0A3Q4GI83_NEOBR
MKSKVTVNVDSKRAELENELVEVLKDTASGLESLSSFLDAVEKLAVTSLHVFTENQVLHLPEGISPEYVQAVILAARVICPLLLEFKRDDNAFFLPKLQNMEVLAYQLDRYIQTSKTIYKMNKGAKISSVAGSSVGAVGGVLSIVGLALIPFTAGVSLALTMTGVGLGITSGVNSVVTTATEVGVNATQRKKASEVFKNFMEDVQSLQSCLEEIAKNTVAIGKGIDALVDSASAVKMLQTEELLTSAGKVVAQEGQALRNAPRVASDIPDIGQAAAKGTAALSNSARAGFIALNPAPYRETCFFFFLLSPSLSRTFFPLHSACEPCALRWAEGGGAVVTLAGCIPIQGLQP